MNKSVVLASLSLAALIGCGGDDPKKPIITTPDAPGGGTTDAPEEAACTTPPQNIAIPAAAMLAFDYTADDLADEMGAQELWTTNLFAIDQNATPDALSITFAEGPAGAYTIQDFGAPPLTLPISGGEAELLKCSICIRMLTDVVVDAQNMISDYGDDYVANAGTLSLTAINATKVTGSITGLTMRHVDLEINAMDQLVGQTDSPSGCTTTFGTIEFDATPTMAKMADGRTGYTIKVSNPRHGQRLVR